MAKGLAKRVLEEDRRAAGSLFDKSATRPKLADESEKAASRLLKPERANPGGTAAKAGAAAGRSRRARGRAARAAIAALGAGSATSGEARGDREPGVPALVQEAGGLAVVRSARVPRGAADPGGRAADGRIRAGAPARGALEAETGDGAAGAALGERRDGSWTAKPSRPRRPGSRMRHLGGGGRRASGGGRRPSRTRVVLRAPRAAGPPASPVSGMADVEATPAARRASGVPASVRRAAGKARMRSKWASLAPLARIDRASEAPLALKGTAVGARAAAGVGAAVGGPAAAAMASAAAALALSALLAAVVLGAGFGAANVSRQGAGGGGTALAKWALGEYEQGPHEGGQRYWSHCGFAGRVEWCSCFVKTGWDECGFGDALGSPQGVGLANSWITWAKGDPGKGNLIAADESYAPAPGDIIVQGQPTGSPADSVHVGIVVSGLDERGAFRTVEGNYGDAVGSAWYFPGQLWNWVFRPAYPAAAAGVLGEGVDFGAGEEAFVREWAPRIDRFYADYSVAAGAVVPLAGHGEDFARSAYRHKVDPRLSPAISINESGGGRVCWYRYGAYDAWGWAAPFPSTGWPDAIDFHIEGLARGYSGLSLDELANKYAAGEAPENIAAWKARLESSIAKM